MRPRHACLCLALTTCALFVTPRVLRAVDPPRPQFVATDLSQVDDVCMIVLPRNKRQEDEVRHLWQRLFKTGKMYIPDRVVDGLNLIWYSDLVISGGGTTKSVEPSLLTAKFSGSRPASRSSLKCLLARSMSCVVSHARST